MTPNSPEHRLMDYLNSKHRCSISIRVAASAVAFVMEEAAKIAETFNVREESGEYRTEDNFRQDGRTATANFIAQAIRTQIQAEESGELK